MSVPDRLHEVEISPHAGQLTVLDVVAEQPDGRPESLPRGHLRADLRSARTLARRDPGSRVARSCTCRCRTSTCTATRPAWSRGDDEVAALDDGVLRPVQKCSTRARHCPSRFPPTSCFHFAGSTAVPVGRPSNSSDHVSVHPGRDASSEATPGPESGAAASSESEPDDTLESTTGEDPPPPPPPSATSPTKASAPVRPASSAGAPESPPPSPRSLPPRPSRRNIRPRRGRRRREGRVRAMGHAQEAWMGHDRASRMRRESAHLFGCTRRPRPRLSITGSSGAALRRWLPGPSTSHRCSQRARRWGWVPH